MMGEVGFVALGVDWTQARITLELERCGSTPYARRWSATACSSSSNRG